MKANFAISSTVSETLTHLPYPVLEVQGPAPLGFDCILFLLMRKSE